MLRPSQRLNLIIPLHVSKKLSATGSMTSHDTLVDRAAILLIIFRVQTKFIVLARTS